MQGRPAASSKLWSRGFDARRREYSRSRLRSRQREAGGTTGATTRLRCERNLVSQDCVPWTGAGFRARQKTLNQMAHLPERSEGLQTGECRSGSQLVLDDDSLPAVSRDELSHGLAAHQSVNGLNLAVNLLRGITLIQDQNTHPFASRQPVRYPAKTILSFPVLFGRWWEKFGYLLTRRLGFAAQARRKARPLDCIRRQTPAGAEPAEIRSCC
jgi:hypothetical protein